MEVTGLLSERDVYVYISGVYDCRERERERYREREREFQVDWSE